MYQEFPYIDFHDKHHYIKPVGKTDVGCLYKMWNDQFQPQNVSKRSIPCLEEEKRPFVEAVI
jgi:hypothetical protein